MYLKVNTFLFEFKYTHNEYSYELIIIGLKMNRIADRMRVSALCDLRGHKGRVWSCAWNPQADLLATAGEDKDIRLWKKVTIHLLKKISLVST